MLRKVLVVAVLISHLAADSLQGGAHHLHFVHEATQVPVGKVPMECARLGLWGKVCGDLLHQLHKVFEWGDPLRAVRLEVALDERKQAVGHLRM